MQKLLHLRRQCLGRMPRKKQPWVCTVVADRLYLLTAGDTAMEDALVLARTSSKVTLIHRRDSFRASKVLAERVKFHDRIEILWNTTVESFEGEVVQDADTGEDVHRLTHVVVRTHTVDGEEGDVSRIEAKGAFVAIGHDPATALVENQVMIVTRIQWTLYLAHVVFS